MNDEMPTGPDDSREWEDALLYALQPGFIPRMRMSADEFRALTDPRPPVVIGTDPAAGPHFSAEVMVRLCTHGVVIIESFRIIETPAYMMPLPGIQVPWIPSKFRSWKQELPRAISRRKTKANRAKSRRK